MEAERPTGALLAGNGGQQGGKTGQYGGIDEKEERRAEITGRTGRQRKQVASGRACMRFLV